MESLNFEQLVKDCLNPRNLDGTPLEQDKRVIQFSNINELDEYISTLTTRMCKKRKENVKLIEPDYNEVQKNIPELIENTSKIKEYITIFLNSNIAGKNIDNDRCKRIIKYCESIIEYAKEYKQNIETMYERFRNGTIRISAVGAAGQGKSTFAKYYTGLSNGVIPTHKKENEETTGTVCTLIHTDSDEVKHIASYYTRQEILDTLNYYLDRIKEITGNNDNDDFSILGISKFIDFEKDFVHNIGKLKISDIPNNTKLTTDLRKGIEAFFAPTKLIRGGYWYNFLDKEPQELKSNEEQLQHILMSDPTSLYLAVKEVRTYIRFPKNGEIFRNFEIVDTKGVGSAAGAHAGKEVYSAIDSSDAVFSIQSVSTDTLYSFYNYYLLNKYAGDEMFRKKHFIILNPYVGSDYMIAVNTLAPMKLSDFAYCGSLYAKDCHRSECVKKEHDNNLDCILKCSINKTCQDFVDYAVRNMLLRVSTMVYELDEDRINKRRKDKISLYENIKQLSEELKNVEDYLYKSSEDVVLDKIREFLIEIQTYVSNINSSEKSDSDKEYLDYLNDGKEITLYDIITSENEDVIKNKHKSIKQSLNEAEEDCIKREIKEALNDSYYSFAKHFKDRKWSQREEVGSFIDDFGDGLGKRIARILVKLNMQKELDPKVRQEISKDIWGMLRLNIIFPESQGIWKGEFIRSNNKFFESLDDIFEPRKSDDQQPKLLFTPYLLLQKYFTNKDVEIDLPEIDKHGRHCEHNGDNNEYLNKDRLVSVATEMLYDLDIQNLVRDIYNSYSESNQRYSIKNNLENLVSVKSGSEECLEFYCMYSNRILSKEENEKIKLATYWKSIKDLVKKIQSTPFAKNALENDNK